MPSGSKKRKAAKKKKEKQGAPAHPRSLVNNDFHSHGEDDLKHRGDDDKDSDAEEVSSPLSQEHPENHKQEEAEEMNAQASSEENKSSGEQKEDNEATRAETEEERDIEIEQEFELAGDELNSQSTSVEDFDHPKDANAGVLQQKLENDESSSNNQFADGEKRVSQNETESKVENDDLDSKTAAVERQKESKDETSMQTIRERSILQKEPDVKPANGKLDDKNESMEGDLESVSQIEDELKTMDGTKSRSDEPYIIDKKIVLVDHAQVSKSIEEVNFLSKGVTELTDTSVVGDHHSSSFEPKYVDEVDELKLCQEKIYGDMIVSAGGNGEMKENKEKEAILQERDDMRPLNCVNLGQDNRETEAIVNKHEEVAATDTKFSPACDVGDKLSVSYNVSVTGTANGSDSSNSPNLVEHVRDPEVSKSVEHQSLIASAPRVVQRSSWMSCCGLFEVFTGSNR